MRIELIVPTSDEVLEEATKVRQRYIEERVPILIEKIIKSFRNNAEEGKDYAILASTSFFGEKSGITDLFSEDIFLVVKNLLAQAGYNLWRNGGNNIVVRKLVEKKRRWYFLWLFKV